MTDSKPSRRGRPPKYSHLNEEELKELARKQAAERQARKRGRDQAEAAATALTLRTLSDALLFAAKERLIDPVSLLDSVRIARAWPTKAEAESGIGFDEAGRLWNRYLRSFLEALAEGRDSIVPPGADDPPAEPTDEERQRLMHPRFVGSVPNGREDARFRFVSLFSGIGAPDLAFSRHGWRCFGHAEIEPFQSAVLAERFPDVSNYGNVDEVDWAAEGRRIGPVHVVVGGPPCQSFSRCGKGGGTDDPRGMLSLRFIDICRDLQAPAFVFENVNSLLWAPSGDGVPKELRGRDFAMLLQRVAEAGYTACWGVFDGRVFGVPQSRTRVFMIGMRTDRWQFPALSVLGPRISLDTPAAALDALMKGGRKARPIDLASNPMDMAVAVKGSWPRAGILHDGKVWVGNAVPETYMDGGDLRAVLDVAVKKPSLLSDKALLSFHSRYKDEFPQAKGLWDVVEAIRDGKSHDDAEYIPAHSGAIRKSRGVNLRSGINLVVVPKGQRPRLMTCEEKERLQGFPSGWTDIVYNGKPAGVTLRDGAIGNSMVVTVLDRLAEYLEIVLPEIVGKAASQDGNS